MTNQSKLHPGEFSRDIAKWQRGVIADIKQLTRGIEREGTGVATCPRLCCRHARARSSHRVSVPASQFAPDNLPQPCLGAPAGVFRWTWALLVLPRPFFGEGHLGGEKRKKPDHGHGAVNLARPFAGRPGQTSSRGESVASS